MPYPPRRHEDEALHTFSEERYFTRTRESSRYEPHSLKGRQRVGQTELAASHMLLTLRGESRSRQYAPRVVSDVCLRDAVRIKYAEEHIATSARHAETGQTRAERVKRSASFAPMARTAEDHAAYAPATRRDARTEPRKQTKVIGIQTTNRLRT